MDSQQLINATDLLELVLSFQDISSDLLTDPMVPNYFLTVSADTPSAQYDFFTLCSLADQVRLTHMDIIEEELILALHIDIGFSVPVLSQWLRSLDYGAHSYFIDQCQLNQVLHLDHIVDQARSQYQRVGDVVLELKTLHFDDLKKIVAYGLNQRISIKQYHDMLYANQPDASDVDLLCDYLIQDKGVFHNITSTQQVLPFRIFCALVEFSDAKDRYFQGILKVFMGLIDNTSIEKCLQLLNTMPYDVIDYCVRHMVTNSVEPMVAHLNQQLPIFEYGHIRKIVRRRGIGLNY